MLGRYPLAPIVLQIRLMPRPHKGKSKCACCGHPTVDERYGLIATRASALFAFGEEGSGPIYLRDVRMTQYQWDAFHQLKYWELVQPGPHQGSWKITADGWDWLAGISRVRKHVWVYQDKVVEFAGPYISIQEAWPNVPYFLTRGRVE